MGRGAALDKVVRGVLFEKVSVFLGQEPILKI